MAARSVARDWRLGRLAFAFDVAMPDRPARPALPPLLPPNRMPRRGRGGSEKGRIALWHALAHIEFSAIDLALDAAGRFGAELGEGFTGDFLTVAADEAMHFALLDRRLHALGSSYGALPAHDGLWDAAYETGMMRRPGWQLFRWCSKRGRSMSRRRRSSVCTRWVTLRVPA